MWRAQEQPSQSLENLQNSIHICKDYVSEEIQRILLVENDSLLKKAVLLQVIYFTLNKLEHLIKQHKNLAFAAIKYQDQFESAAGPNEQLIQLIHLSDLTFKEIKNIYDLCSKNIDKYENIYRNALKLIIALGSVLAVYGIAICIASVLVTIPVMPIFYSLISLLGAVLISTLIAYSSSKYADYLRYKIPPEIIDSYDQFYDDKLYISSDKHKDKLNCYKLALYLTDIVTEEPNLIKMRPKIDSSRPSHKLELEDPKEKHQIHYCVAQVTSTSECKIYYQKKYPSKMQSFSIAKNQIMPNQAEVTFDQDKIKVAILENIVKVPANKFNPKFFSNAIKRILPEAGNQHGCLIRPSDQISSRFAETVGLNIDTPSTNHN